MQFVGLNFVTDCRWTHFETRSNVSASDFRMLVWAVGFNFDLVMQSAGASSQTEVDYTRLCADLLACIYRGPVLPSSNETSISHIFCVTFHIS